MDVFLHFLFPYAILTLIGLKAEKAIPLALLGIVPDLDILFYVHRSPSHSAVVITAAFIIPIIAAWLYRREYLHYAILGYLSTVSHPIFDMLGGYTPILWPLYNQSIMISIQLILRINPVIQLEPQFAVKQIPITFPQIETFHALVFNGPGALMATLIAVYVCYRVVQWLKNYRQ